MWDYPLFPYITINKCFWTSGLLKINCSTTQSLDIFAPEVNATNKSQTVYKCTLPSAQRKMPLPLVILLLRMNVGSVWKAFWNLLSNASSKALYTGVAHALIDHNGKQERFHDAFVDSFLFLCMCASKCVWLGVYNVPMLLLWI